ncbi:MAG: acyl-CoA dehydrogenase family protein, partial [Methylocystaceae bacterium]
MEFALTKEQLLIQKSAREFAEKYIDPVATEIDRTNSIPDSIIKGLAELDFLGLPYPEEYGGAGAGYLGYVLATEQLSRASGGVAMTMSVHTLGLGAIFYFATEEQKHKYFPDACSGKTLASFAFTEPQTGSDPKSISTTAVKDGDHYIINGTKRFISNANYPGPIVIFAKDETNGGISAFIVDKFCAGYSISEPWEKIGLHGGVLLDVYLKDVKVPAENLLGQPGKGYFILQTGISFGKVGMSCGSLGGILAGFEEAVKYAKEKTHRDQPIAKFPTVQLHIAEIAMKYEAA